MKILTLYLLFLFSDQLYAQSLSGYVFDEVTRKPIPGATVSAGSQISITTENGHFNLKDINLGTGIRVSHISYKTYYFSSNAEIGVRVFMKKNITVLNSVVILALGKYETDSIKIRNEFSSAFSYKKLTWKDLFITKSRNNYPRSQSQTNSYNSLIGINLLQFAALLSGNKAPILKLQKNLLKDEEENYVDKMFSEGKISAITSLNGDSLKSFIIRFRPSVNTARQLTEYEMIEYIKKSYSEYVQYR
jgi:hypothetical protein